MGKSNPRSAPRTAPDHAFKFRYKSHVHTRKSSIYDPVISQLSAQKSPKGRPVSQGVVVPTAEAGDQYKSPLAEKREQLKILFKLKRQNRQSASFDLGKRNVCFNRNPDKFNGKRFQRNPRFTVWLKYDARKDEDSGIAGLPPEINMSIPTPKATRTTRTITSKIRSTHTFSRRSAVRVISKPVIIPSVGVRPKTAAVGPPPGTIIPVAESAARREVAASINLSECFLGQVDSVQSSVAENAGEGKRRDIVRRKNAEAAAGKRRAGKRYLDEGEGVLGSGIGAESKGFSTIY